MTNSNKSFHEYLMNDVFAGMDGISSKSMFGGYGYYKNGKIFGIVAEGKLFFKVGESNKSDYESRGLKPYVFKAHNGREQTLSYWEVPEDIVEDSESLEEWIEKAIQAHKKS